MTTRAGDSTRATLLLVLPTLCTVLATPGRAAPSLEPGERTVAAPPLPPTQRKTAVEGLARALRTHYVWRELGERSARKLLQSLARGGYDQAHPDELAAALTRD